MVADSPARGIDALPIADPPRMQCPDESTLTLVHEISNPLAAVLAALDYVMEHEDAPGGEMGAALRDAHAAAERIHAIITRLRSNPAESTPAPASTTFARAAAGIADPATKRDPGRARVLVVDDDVMVAAALRRGLASIHDVTLATNAEDALARVVGGERFDIILCDMMMPGMQGFELYAELARLDGDQAGRVIFLTGGATTSKAQAFMERMSGRVVLKPVDMTTLRELIRRQLQA